MAHDDRLAVVLRRHRQGSEIDPRDEQVKRLEAELHAARVGLRIKIEDLTAAQGQLAALATQLQVAREGQRSLEQELAVATAELDRIREELGQAQSDHAGILAALSHELRNPVALIGCGLEVLEHVEPGGALARRALAVLHRQFGHLSHMIEDLLDVTRVRHGKLQLRREPLDLGELVHHTVEGHRDAFAAAGIALEFTAAPGGLSIHGDPTRLRQVLGNLLHNASKFTPRGGAARVSVVAASTCGMIRVQDTGPGIHPAMLSRVFEPFLQASTAPDDATGGLGLGLAVVKGVIEAHGGAVSAESEGHGRGATFTISLPLTTG